jgi:hypothetical protein
MEGGMPDQNSPLMVGTDRMTRRGEQMIIHSAIDIDDWRIGVGRKTAILIGDEVWCLAGKETSPSGNVRYILDPWPEYMNQIPGRRIRYDEAYVQSRDEAEKARKILERGYRWLIHYRMFIGFLPSRVKLTIEERYGVPARNASFISIMIEFFLFFMMGAVAQIFGMAGALSGQEFDFVSLVALIGLTLIVDFVFRYDSFWRGDHSPWGFLEWALHPSRIGVPMQSSGLPGRSAMLRNLVRRLHGKAGKKHVPVK